MSAPRIVTGYPDQDGVPGFVLRLPFPSKGNGLDILAKAGVPQEARAFEVDTGSWWVAEDYRAAVVDGVLLRFGRLEIMHATGNLETLAL